MLDRSKLLLSVPPRKVHLRGELERRLQLWADGKLDELLIRIEEQARCIPESRRQRLGRAGDRARRLSCGLLGQIKEASRGMRINFR